MKFTNNKYNYFFNVFLFSGLGSLSYLFLIEYTDLPESRQLELMSFWAFVSVVFVFNVLGFCLMLVDNWLKKDYLYLLKRRRTPIVYYMLIALSLFLLNYLLLVWVKWNIDADHPFAFRWSGMRMLITIWLVELVIIGLTMANNFYRHIIVLYKKMVSLEESSIKAQYMALQNQLNPHFLFNSLNTLISEIEYNPKNAVSFAEHLSDVYRYILQCQEQRLVTLRSELGFLDSYIFLHRVRLGDCIHVDNQVDVSLWEMKIPPLTLQLLAENVIKHNTIHAGKPMCITLSCSGDPLLLTMTNEIRPKQGVVPSGTGLKNLSARYKLICGVDVVVEKEDDCFTVKIPLLYE